MTTDKAAESVRRADYATQWLTKVIRDRLGNSKIHGAVTVKVSFENGHITHVRTSDELTNPCG